MRRDSSVRSWNLGSVMRPRPKRRGYSCIGTPRRWGEPLSEPGRSVGRRWYT